MEYDLLTQDEVDDNVVRQIRQRQMSHYNLSIKQDQLKASLAALPMPVNPAPLAEDASDDDKAAYSSQVAAAALT